MNAEAAVHRPTYLLNLVLFVATIVTTLLVGADADQMQRGVGHGLRSGWMYSVSILLILGAHELGHYFAAQWHRQPASLPYFLPFPPPFSPLGTLGAVITMKQPVTNRKALFDIAVAGPIAGLFFAIPLLIVGLASSEIAPLPTGEAYLLEGDSLLYVALKRFIFGEAYPAAGLDVQLNQMAWAGWGGLLVTAVNLLPIGTLDGGHAANALFGRSAKWLFWPVIIALVAISLIFVTPMWAIWIGVLLLFGRATPQPFDEHEALGNGRKIVAVVLFLTFILIFVPVPLQIIGG